jgi:hypothetical protein
MNNRSRRIAIQDPDTAAWYRVSAAHCARVCGVSLRTAQRWAARRSMPEPALRLLRLTVFGVPPSTDWRGFRFRSGGLVNLETADILYPGEVRGVAMAWAESAALRARLRQLDGQGGRVLRYIKKPGQGAGSG